MKRKKKKVDRYAKVTTLYKDSSVAGSGRGGAICQSPEVARGQGLRKVGSQFGLHASQTHLTQFLHLTCVGVGDR